MVQGFKYGTVAPHRGAWIETKLRTQNFLRRKVSHPARARGLKTMHFANVHNPMAVAPLRGAWIETISTLRMLRRHRMSHPARGAWIETSCLPTPLIFVEVAPRRGAWIETICSFHRLRRHRMSHPVGVRGLKPLRPICSITGCVAPRRGAWIERKKLGATPAGAFALRKGRGYMTIK